MAKAAIFLGFSWLAQYGSAKEVHLDWNVTWVNAAPNGHQRPVIGINGEWPCPQIDLDLGDRLIVDLYNGLGNQSTGLHWHGFRQYMTGTMDGASEVTQCPLAPGSRMTYDFTVNQTGSYWYHSHNMGQYPDGLRGPIIVHDPSPPYSFDEEITLTVTEWYNEQMPTLLNMYQSEDSGGKEPLPDSTLINDASDTKIKVQPNKTYLVHLICLGNWPGHTFVFDDHQLTVVEVDGVWTQPYDVTDKKLRITTGQRMSVLIKTKPDASRNYAMWDSTDLNMMFFYEDRDIPSNFNPNATAWLVYDESKELPGPPDIHGLDPNADFVDDVEFVPYDQEELLAPVDRQIVLHTASREIDDVVRFTVNGEPYISPEVPSLYTGMTADNSSDAEIYGQVNPMIVHHNEVVELVINNHHGNLHPWHLHGHQFQVLQRSSVDGGSFLGYFQNISSTPVKRDTIMVQNHGHTVIRFRADNPDKSPTTLKKISLWIILTFFIRVWLLHCHIEWHVEGGLVATLIEAPEELQKLSIPTDHKDICSSYGTPTSGNAAGNTGDDMTGANTNFQPGSAGAITKPKPAANVPSPNSGSGSGSNPSSEPTGQPAPKNPSPEPSNPEPQPTPEPQNDPPSAQDQQWEQPPFATLDEDNFVWLARHKPQIPNNA